MHPLEIEIRGSEPTPQDQNLAKRTGVETMTPARALVAELVRRYWILGMECSLLEIQDLAWFLDCAIKRFSPADNPLELTFIPDKYGPCANNQEHLLNNLDNNYLHCEKPISEAGPLDVIWFNDESRPLLQSYLMSEANPYLEALEYTAALIDGFESPFGMELLATVDWLLVKEKVAPRISSLREGLRHWPGAAVRKDRLFDDRALEIALERLIRTHDQKMRGSA